MIANAVAMADGCTLAWQRLGDGADAVLLHGLATSRAFWYPTLAQRLKAGRRVTLYDLRGHGYSGKSPDGYSAAAQAGDLLQLLDALDIGEADLVGHSYGGAIALEFAARHPYRVRRLALLDVRVNVLQPTQWLHESPHLSDFEREVAAADGRDWAREPQVGFAFLEAAARLHGSGRKPQAADAFSPFASARGGQRLARQYLDLVESTSLNRDAIAPGASAQAIARLVMPVLLLYGERSRCLPSGEVLARLLPQATLQVIRAAGHFFPATHADAVGAHVSAFLGLATPSQGKAA